MMSLSVVLLLLALLLCVASFSGRVPLAASVLLVIVERLLEVLR